MVVESRQPALMLAEQLRPERRLPVSRDVQAQLASGREQGLWTAAVAVTIAPRSYRPRPEHTRNLTGSTARKLHRLMFKRSSDNVTTLDRGLEAACR
jgi:predicted ABC-type transport system involved in lysophospholipase L1 biosynthesis ATPase subunit